MNISLKTHLQSPQHTRNLALAVVQALQLWSNARYRAFLLGSKPAELTEQWFRWFVGEWKVARTIRDGQLISVRDYLDQDFRKALVNEHRANAVDSAAEYIQREHWSSQTGKSRQGSLPISLVSKVGFFLCPSELVPLDRYSVQGLNNLRKMNGAPKLKGRSYSEYLTAFNEHFTRMNPLIHAGLTEPWGISLAHKLGCPDTALSTTAMHRKVFDNYLMHVGNYGKASGDAATPPSASS